MRVLTIYSGVNSNVCVLNDNRIELYLKEENYTKCLRDDFPLLCLQEVYEKYKKNNIDFILFCGNKNDSEDFVYYEKYIKKLFSKPLLVSPVVDRFVKHNAKAAYAFYNSGFEKSLVLVLDSEGSVDYDEFGSEYKESESIFYSSYPDVFIPLYKKIKVNSELISEKLVNDIRKQFKFTNFHFSKNGLSDLYESQNSFIGKGEYDVSYSTDASLLTENTFDLDLLSDDGNILFENFNEVEYERFGNHNPLIYSGFEGKYVPIVLKDNCEIPAKYCNTLNQISKIYVSRLIRKYLKDDIKNICITGNCATNHLINSHLLEEFPDINFYFENNCDGSELSIGMALNYMRMITRDTNLYNFKKNYFSNSKNKYSLLDGQREEYSDIVKVSKLLQEDKVISYIENKKESGVKQLSSRCILANPNNLDFRKYLDPIKLRPWYRTYPIVILEDLFKDYFETYNRNKNENLLVSFSAKNRMIEKYSHVLSQKGTCRVQTISEKNKSDLYRILKSFYEDTGCPFLICTSFNDPSSASPLSKDDCLLTYYGIQKNKFIKYGIYGLYFCGDKKMIIQENEKFDDEEIENFFANSDIIF